MEICLHLLMGRVPEEGWSVVGATSGMMSPITASSVGAQLPEILARGDRHGFTQYFHLSQFDCVSDLEY